MGRGTVGMMSAVSVVLFLSLLASPAAGVSFNITTLLNAYPRFSQFNQMLSSSGVAEEINAHSSITVTVVANPILTAFLALYPNADAGQVADLFRYQCLLQYLDTTELKTITLGNPSTVTTLYQTTGRAAGSDGSVNIYYNGSIIQEGLSDPAAPPNATILGNVTQLPYNISILELDHVVAFNGFGTPTAAANITEILVRGQTFTQLISLLQSTGVDAVFTSLETGSGITIFAPTDNAFNALPPGSLDVATPAIKKLVLEYHALTAYYTLGSLSTVNNPAAPTVATKENGAATYLLNVSSVPGGAVTLNSGVSTATISATLYDTPPTVVFAINNVLLPKDIFAVAPAPAPGPEIASAPSPSNETAPAPAPGPLSPTPTPAPSPLTPSPTPTPTPSPTPSPTPTPGPAPVLSPDLAPGPPAPLTPTGEEPALAPDGSSPPPGAASNLSRNFLLLGTMAVLSFGFAAMQ